jgi:hypothetical protein
MQFSSNAPRVFFPGNTKGTGVFAFQVDGKQNFWRIARIGFNHPDPVFPRNDSVDLNFHIEKAIAFTSYCFFRFFNNDGVAVRVNFTLQAIWTTIKS